MSEWLMGVIAFGWSNGHSVQEVADFPGVSKYIVQQVFKQCQTLQSITNGHKTVLTDRDCYHVPCMHCDRKNCPRHSMHIHNKPFLNGLVWRKELNVVDSCSRVPWKRLLLRVIHKTARLQWGQSSKHWTVITWRLVIWSDELHFCLYMNDVRRQVHCKPHDTIHEDCVQVGFTLEAAPDVQGLFQLQGNRSFDWGNDTLEPEGLHWASG